MDSQENSSRAGAEGLLVGGGEMGALVRAHDWSRTELGPMECWPRSLLTAVDVCLNSRFPMVVFWGPQLITLYNDAYRPSFGAKHPRVLGAPAATLWNRLAWDVLGPMMSQVVESGVPTWSEDQFLLVDRNGFPEESYWTFSYSPIRGDRGYVEGVFTAVTETTSRILGERRLRTLRELGSEVAHARGEQDAARVTVDVLSRNPRDLPFTLIYLGDGKRLWLRGASGQAVERFSAPEEVNAASGEGLFEGLFEGALFRVLARGESETIEDPCGKLGMHCVDEGHGLPQRALALPIASPGQEGSVGILVVGLSPLLVLDESYRGFLGLVAGQLATAISAARAYEEEKKRAEALAELDRAKTAFFSNVSHEFRTPLTLMLGPVEDGLADLEHPLPPVQRERQQLVHRSGLRLLKLVNTLLDFSRIEAGRVQATFVPTELALLTTDLASVFRSAVEKAGVRLTVACAPLPEAVWVDREMWEKIVLNLVSNAFKFTFEGEIIVSLWARGERVELLVRDTGTGIPEQELPCIFERFHQVKGARGRSYEGSGIGLALVRELVRLHGGDVRVESAMGRGSTFTVSVPFGNAHLPADRLGVASRLSSSATTTAAYVQEAHGWLARVAEPTPLPAGRPSTETQRHGSSIPRGHVLIADDNADIREYVRRLLEGSYTVEAVESGTRALEAARARPPDLVLSDVMMPGLDGFGLLRELKADACTAHVPVILLSARAGEEATVEGLEAGADDYLVKPFAARELIARVDGSVRLARERARRERLIQERADFEQQLIGIVSHDLRNPLAAISLSAEVLLHGADIQERQRRPLGRIVSSAERTTRMIRDLLDFTQARLGGGLPIKPEPLDLHALARQMSEEHQVAHPGRQLQVEARGNGHGVWDADRLAQVLGNLLGNALRYSPPGTPVRVRTFGQVDQVVLEVHNTGTPIPVDVLPRLFQPMQRGAGASDTSSRGVGLGLYIVKHIVEAHGGTIQASSTEEGHITFTVTLPRRACRPPPVKAGA
jgi:signal transduction histidine kinase